jgi:hypothetical protein
LVDKVKDLFAEPQSIPSRRAIDHQIPLIHGAQPVNVHPYHYSPRQKDEIEKQVNEMLQLGIIELNSSPFASSVLLVKKKDRSWCFCVDYRALNALIVKNKLPLPVVEELLDELAGGRWFTKLDLRLGYHQIHMAARDEYKMAFHTIFSEFLHKVVPVFMDDISVYSATLEEHVHHLTMVF